MKMKKLTNDNPKENSSKNQNNLNPIEYASNEKVNKDTYKSSTEIISMKNNSGRFVFTLNGENEKSEKKTNTKEQIKSEEKTEKTESTKKDIIQKKVTINENVKNKKKEEEKEIGSSSSHKKEKEREHIIHNSNRLKEISLNSISSIDNNIESAKYLNGKNFDSINKLLADIGTIRGRRKSNITNSHFRKNLLNDMVSFSSSHSIFVLKRRNSTFNFRFSRYNSSKNFDSPNGFNIPIILNNLKNINNEKMESTHNNNYNPTQEDSLSLINKLKNLKVSLENEKSFSNLMKNVKLAQNKNKKNKNNNFESGSKNENIQTKNKNNINANNKGSTRSRDINTISTKSTGSKIFYPKVYYINPDSNLHKKTHVSTFFSKLKHEK